MGGTFQEGQANRRESRLKVGYLGSGIGDKGREKAKNQGRNGKISQIERKNPCRIVRGFLDYKRYHIP
jgi:hypothetical protein